MMNDVYAEYLVKRKSSAAANVLTVVMGAVTAVILFLALFGSTLFLLAAAACGFLTYLLKRNANVEYEYLYVSGQLSVDKILGQAKRKNAWEGSMEEIQIIAPSDSYVLNDYRVSNSKKLDFSSGRPGARTYTVIWQSGSQAAELILEPNDKMLQCFRQTAPRKIVL